MKNHIKVFTGYAYYSHERTVNQDLQDETYHGGAFEFGIGAEVDIERMMKGGSAELSLSFSPKTKFEHDTMVRGGHEPSHTTYEKGRVSCYIGVLKRFGKGSIVPLVRGGGFYVYQFGNHETRIYQDRVIVDLDWENTAHFGLYLGAGVQMAVGKHVARLHGDCYKSIGKGNMMKWGATAEFVF